ncbi:MAG TPA: glycosyltransferase [Chitinivibrionales bacterium]|nr:glycosyltransferase [Chitinivibrionales bacterium]
MIPVIVCTLYVMCSIALLAYGAQCYILTYLYLRKRPVKLDFQRRTMNYFDSITDEKGYPTVVTQLPMYNEKTVAKRIIEAVAAMDYPLSKHEIQVLDDSKDETRELVDKTVARLAAQGHRISVIRRTDRTGFKAGALQYGLERTEAEFVAIFDADFVPHKDFLKKSICFFINRPKLGLVQGRWAHLNSTASLITRQQAMGIDGHFMVEQAARSWNNLFMNFNGTAGVFRREAIKSSGGWHHDTLTEDMDLSYRMQLKDWETEYVPDLEVPAELPEDINAFKNQQFRWAKGSIQTALKIIPLLYRKKLPIFKFLQAILHLTHYSVHPLMLMLAFLTLPVLFFFKVYLHPAILASVISTMILATSGPASMYMISQHYLGHKIRRKILMVPAMMLIGTGLAVNNARAVIEALFRKNSEFLRTPKKGQYAKTSYKPLKDITWMIELFCGLYCLTGLWLFIGFSNAIVSPFLVLYSSGFLFVGMLSILHYRRPELISLRLWQQQLPAPE